MSSLNLEPDEDTGGRKGKSGAEKPPSETELRKLIEEGVNELAEWVADRGLTGVADAMKADAKRMGNVLSVRSVRHEKVARVVLVVFGKDSIVAAARAFGPTIREFGAWLRGRREERASEGDPESPEAEERAATAEPWRV
jgi:hypothetical protein